MPARRGDDDVRVTDWLTLAQALAPASVDFLYADPPFNTGLTKEGRRGVRASFADSWPTMDAYIHWLGQRVSATLPAMRPTGVVAIHGDHRASHHIRLLLDRLLTPANFINHLVWSYGLGGSSPRRFARKHDDIIVYAVDARRYYFHPPMVPATSRRLKGRLKKATDVLEIPAINNMAAERTGYPTQKPLALLDVLVRAFCPEGGTVLDPCCGSGTTLVAAALSRRRVIGGDISTEGVRVARARLEQARRAVG